MLTVFDNLIADVAKADSGQPPKKHEQLKEEHLDFTQQMPYSGVGWASMRQMFEKLGRKGVQNSNGKQCRANHLDGGRCQMRVNRCD